MGSSTSAQYKGDLNLEETHYYRIDKDLILFKLVYTIPENVKPILVLQREGTPIEFNLTPTDINWLRKYTSGSYLQLNLNLLTNNQIEQCKDFIKGVFSACFYAYQPSLPGIVYRKLQVEKEEFDQYKVGGIFRIPAFVSTSRKLLTYWKGNCIVTILLKRTHRKYAIDIHKYSLYPDEAEVLLACYSKYKVISKSEYSSTDSGILLEYLDYSPDE